MHTASPYNLIVSRGFARRGAVVLGVSVLLHVAVLVLLRGDLSAPIFDTSSTLHAPITVNLVAEPPAPPEIKREPAPQPRPKPRPQPVPAPVAALPQAPAAEAPRAAEPPLEMRERSVEETRTETVANESRNPELMNQDGPPQEAPLSASPAEPVDEDVALKMAVLGGARAFDIPSRALYTYKVTTPKLPGVSGTGVIGWAFNRETLNYQAGLAFSAFGATFLRQSSTGRLQPWGLAPERYIEKSGRRSPAAANLNWQDRRVTFSAREYEREISDGVQDRLSFLFQLTLLGQRVPEAFAQGRTIVLRVAGARDVATYRLQVLGKTMLQTPSGAVEAIHLERPKQPEEPGGDLHIQVWLAPALQWQAVKVRTVDRRDDVIEMVLESVAQGDVQLPLELMTN